MKKKNPYKNITEENIIKNYLKKLSLNKKGTFNFENDAAYLNLNKNNKLVVTTDSISENIDFFKNDDPKSIACKIATVNLSDLSSMGAKPYAYNLSLFIPSYIDNIWLKKFSNELLRLQKKYNFYLIGGDLSRSSKLQISSSFFGLSKNNIIVSQTSIKKNFDIWVTGNLGDSYMGLQILKKRFNVNNLKLKNYFINKYYYPEPCMIGNKISKFVSSMKDISDGFVGDLKKMLNHKFGAEINFDNIPISFNLSKMIKGNIIKKKSIINSGDNYNLIVITNKIYRNQILNTAKKNNVKITLVGKVIRDLQIRVDSNKSLNIPNEFDHFL